MASHQNLTESHLFPKVRRPHKVSVAIIWMIFTFILSSMSKGTTEKLKLIDFVGIDKIGHFIIYMVFAFLWIVALEGFYSIKKAIPSGFLVSVLFGILMELGQFLLFEGRYFEVMDIIANIIGSFVGLILIKKFIK